MRQTNRGRHPLPEPRVFASMLAKKGIGKHNKLIVYDDKLGSLAVRLWWMMKWIGAVEPAILDGGLDKWRAENRSVEAGASRTLPPQPLMIPRVNSHLIVEASTVENAAHESLVLLDARAPERFRGDVEPIDVRGGHIPGAINAPWAECLTADVPQVLKSPQELREHFAKYGVTDSANVVCYCGSGVTACTNIFALHLAGFKNVQLYPGSWSEWIALHEATADELS
jgi:thiosulfate/3-mercaptopyruvate sulfurtransferase